MTRYPADVIAAAEDTYRDLGAYASVTLAQWALESTYGAHLSGRNNPFGIKGRLGEDCTSCVTHEVVNGKTILTTALFRNFATLKDAFEDHARIFLGDRYAEAQKVEPLGAYAYARALAHPYATDPQYGAKLCSIMLRDKLTQFDTLACKGSAEVSPKPLT